MGTFTVGNIISTALEILKYMIIVRCILSFVRHNPHQPIIKFIYDITDPIMRPFRRLVPAMGGLDFSPIVVFFVIWLVQVLVVRFIRF